MSHFDTLQAISPLDGRYADQLPQTLRTCLSEHGLIAQRVFVEIRWLIYLSCVMHLAPAITPEEKDFLESKAQQVTLEDAHRIKRIERDTRHDVKAIEYFLQELLESREGLRPLIPWIHFGCTSEDINNVSYALILYTVQQDIIPIYLKRIVQHLQKKSRADAAQAMLSRTHGQKATPTTLGKELSIFLARLNRQIQQFTQQDILAKWNGAVGNYNAWCVAAPHIDWPHHAQQFVTSLGLVFNPWTTQIEPHDGIAEYVHVLARINTILLDCARDLWSYIGLGYFQQNSSKHAIGSSTMPHKINPIDFENAEGNLGIAVALSEHLAHKLPISRWQRDLSDATVLRNLGCIIGHSILAYTALDQGFQRITVNAQVIEQDVSASWEVLTEAIQTVMRAHGVPNAYEQLKEWVHTHEPTENDLHDLIETLPISHTEKQKLHDLKPNQYIGYAESLTHSALDLVFFEK